ncbi:MULTISPECIES: ANR family transcriptional regulator [unclassified Pantoea]|uniref:ANR family transcriptional regulator n=1 Tax=unclassified Pantoea TaxID=2630326 RepID=UPI00301C749C
MKTFNKVRVTLRNKRYYYIAEAAARAEWFGQYQQASGLWFRAMSLAEKQCNAEWAEHRHSFCETAIRNGWSQKES